MVIVLISIADNFHLHERFCLKLTHLPDSIHLVLKTGSERETPEIHDENNDSW